MEFKLPDEFVESYDEPEWGFKSGPNSLGELTYIRSYSREMKDGRNERWKDTVRRVVEGTYELQRRHCLENERHWINEKAQESAQEMYDRIFHMKFTPPGRGLWAMGSDYVMERNEGAPLNNCAFISTHWPKDASFPYWWIMTMLMLGVGIGADVKGAGVEVIGHSGESYKYVIPDTREGWSDSTRALLDAFFLRRPLPDFDYSEIRPKGAPIKGFGGIAPGPEPLVKLHKNLRRILERRVGETLTSEDVADIVNLIGTCVVAGGVRRSAEVLLGDPEDYDFLNLKNRDVKPQRQKWSWASNNSIVVEEDSQDVDWAQISELIASNGEPGVYFLNNARKYARMGEFDDADAEAVGANPCMEQVLHNAEVCCLVEVNPTRCDDLEDFLRTLKFAYLYAKTVTLVETQIDVTDEIIKRNRRIGTSISGVVKFVEENGKGKLRKWLRLGYNYIQGLDRQYSRWLGVNESIRTTTVKPSGTVSLLSGQTPGVHYPVADYYIRRIRLSEDSELISLLEEAGYHVEPDVYSDNTSVVSLPIKGEGLPTEKDVSISEKAELAAFMARNWSDNAVSVTVTFDKEERGEIKNVLDFVKDRVKSISFLEMDTGAYEQKPYESISREQYDEMVEGLKPIDYSEYHGDGQLEKFCKTDACDLEAFYENAVE